MAWFYLIIAGLCEIGWAIGIKYSHGLTRLWPTVFTIVGMLVSFVFLSLAAKRLPIGTAYAVWTGIGAVGVAIIGIVALGEPRTLPRLLSMALIVIGIVGLKLSSPTP